jgi:peptidoglycan/LPS O-acetylase OafA/YrhL
MSTKPIQFSRTNASVLLDLLRAIAALLVCLGHWRNLLFLDYPQISRHRALLSAPYVLTGAGHQAVVIFFVLSGYLISGNIFRLIRDGRWSWRTYLIHRLTRLWLVLFPALLLGGLWDIVGLHLHSAQALYGGLVANHVTSDVANTLNIRCFFGNLFFLQNTFVQCFGSNSPLWSLANEFWYYLLFPLALLACQSKCTKAARVVQGALFLVLAWLVGIRIMSLFPIWLLGSGLAAFRLPKIPNLLRVIVVITYILLFFFLAKSHLAELIASDYLLGFATSALLLCLLSHQSESSDSFWVRTSRTGARFSYTLYVVHMPFLLLLAAMTVHSNRWSPSFPNLTIGLCELALTILYAFLVARATEFHTDQVRRWIESKKFFTA